MASGDKDVVTYDTFSGLRNTVDQGSFKPGDLVVARNVDITDAFKVRRRRGYSTPLVAGSYHSVWSEGDYCFAVSGSTLYLISADFSTAILRTDLTPGLRMSYAAVGERVYFSNGKQTGVWDGARVRSWGLAVPAAQPTASAIGGSLRAATYQYAVTFVRDDGQESGTGDAGSITLASTGGIAFSSIPISADPTVTTKRLYVSPPDGDALYLLDTLAPGATAATYMTERTGTYPLHTQFLTPPPAGAFLTYFNGRIYIGSGPRVYYSEPFAVELFDTRKNYVFPSPVTLVASMNDGLYLGTDTEVGWVAGEDPAKSSYEKRLGYGVIPGTGAYITGADVEKTAQGLYLYFATTQGLCRGADGGTIENLTQERFNYPPMQRGAGVVRKIGGAVQYIAILQGTEDAANAAF